MIFNSNNLIPNVEPSPFREYIATPDGGQFALDWLVNKGPDDLDRPIVMVVPGITGESLVRTIEMGSRFNGRTSTSIKL